MSLLDGLGLFTGAIWLAAFYAFAREEIRDLIQNRLNSHSRYIPAIEMIHFTVGFLFGACPWLRPWNQAAGVGYILIKKLFVDPWLIKRGFWQGLELREKGAIDIIPHLQGQLIGTVIYWLFVGLT